MSHSDNHQVHTSPALQELSRDDVLCLLEERLDAMTDLTYDEREIDALLAELEARDPLPQTDTEASLADFHARHGLPPVSQPLSIAKPHIGRRLSISLNAALRRSVAAAAVLTVLYTAVAQALGADPVGALVRWTNYVLDREEAPGGVPKTLDPRSGGPALEVPTPEQAERYPYRYQAYDSLTDFLRLRGIYDQLEVAAGTAGFSFVHVAAEHSTTCISVSALYSDGQRQLHQITRHYLTEELPTPSAPDGTVFTAGGVEHHILPSDDGGLVAWWVNGSNICSLTGDVTWEEMLALLESIYLDPVSLP